MDDATSGAPDGAFDPADGPAVNAKVVLRSDGPAECTLWDGDLPEGELTRAWITAEGDAFVSLAEMR
jgi:hypothetical protein